MWSGDDIPGNVNTGEVDLNNGGWIVIAVLIAIIVALCIILAIKHYLAEKKYKKLNEFYNQDLSDKEKELIYKFRKLNSTEQTIVEDTLKTLTKNKTDKEHRNDGI